MRPRNADDDDQCHRLPNYTHQHRHRHCPRPRQRQHLNVHRNEDYHSLPAFLLVYTTCNNNHGMPRTDDPDGTEPTDADAGFACAIDEGGEAVLWAVN